MYNNRPVILCIGSDKVSGDILGPLAGTILNSDYSIDAYIYGTLERPVHGLNIDSYLRFIRNIHKDSLIISIDAAVGHIDDIGKIKLKDNGVNAGGALGYNNKVEGIGIVGVVAENKGDVMSNLLFADYTMVERLSRKIADIIYNSINQVEMH